MSRVSALLVAVVLGSACKSRSSDDSARPSAPSEAPGAPVTSAAPPPVAAPPARGAMIPSSLAHCLKPPYVVGNRPAPIGGFQVHRASEGFVLVQQGPQISPIAREQAQGLDATLRSKLGAGYGGPTRARHCGRDPAIPLPPERCMAISVHLCNGTVAGIAEHFRAALDAAGLGGSSIGLEVKRFGRAEPRCASDDATCLPSPYASPTDQGALPYDASLPRRVVEREHGRSAGSCAHDGHCVSQAEQCFAWYEPVTPVLSRSRRIEMLDDQCGCVDKKCVWFEPARPGVAVNAKLTAAAWSDSAQNAEEAPPRVGLEKTLTGPRVTRALRACYHDHMDALPAAFQVQIRVDASGAAKTTRVEAEKDTGGRLACVDAAIRTLSSLPPPSTGKAASLDATLTVSKE